MIDKLIIQSICTDMRPFSFVDDDRNYIIATLLVPMWKQHPFEEINHQKCKDILINAVSDTSSRDSSPRISDENSDDSDPIERLLKQRYEFMGSPPAISPPMVDDRVRAIAEVEDYLTRPRDKSYEKSSSFWNDPINSAKYPRLKALVHKYHSAPANHSAISQ
ncbi:hypothetical protein ACQ4LE_002773 [Meloidogyne hapla]